MCDCFDIKPVEYIDPFDNKVHEAPDFAGLFMLRVLDEGYVPTTRYFANRVVKFQNCWVCRLLRQSFELPYYYRLTLPSVSAGAPLPEPDCPF